MLVGTQFILALWINCSRCGGNKPRIKRKSVNLSLTSLWWTPPSQAIGDLSHLRRSRIGQAFQKKWESWTNINLQASGTWNSAAINRKMKRVGFSLKVYAWFVIIEFAEYAKSNWRMSKKQNREVDNFVNYCQLSVDKLEIVIIFTTSQQWRRKKIEGADDGWKIHKTIYD